MYESIYDVDGSYRGEKEILERYSDEIPKIDNLIKSVRKHGIYSGFHQNTVPSPLSSYFLEEIGKTSNMRTMMTTVSMYSTASIEPMLFYPVRPINEYDRQEVIYILNENALHWVKRDHSQYRNISRQNLVPCLWCSKSNEIGSIFCKHCGEDFVVRDIDYNLIKCRWCGETYSGRYIDDGNRYFMCEDCENKFLFTVFII